MATICRICQGPHVPFDAAIQAEYEELETWANGHACQRCHRPVVTVLGQEAESCDYGMLSVGGATHHGCALLMNPTPDSYPPHVVAWAAQIDHEAPQGPEEDEKGTR